MVLDWLDRTKIGAEIAKMAFEIWCMVADRRQKEAEREQRIRELEQRVADLAKKLEGK